MTLEQLFGDYLAIRTCLMLSRQRRRPNRFLSLIWRGGAASRADEWFSGPVDVGR